MKKELCVTTKPWITSYSYYALPQCIIQAEDKIGKIVATFQIAESASNDWSKIGNWKQERSQWYLLDETAFGLDCNACLYREVSREKDFIHIKIEKQRYSGPWGAVNLFLTDNKEDILLGDNEYLCRFGSFVYDGLHLYKEGKEQKIQTAYNGKFPCSFSFDVDIPYELVLSRRGNVAEVYGGTDKLDLLSRTDLPVAQEEKWYIGIQVKHENNTFYPWFYSNFIALSLNEGKKVTIDDTAKITEFCNKFSGLTYQFDYEKSNHEADLSHLYSVSIYSDGAAPVCQFTVNSTAGSLRVFRGANYKTDNPAGFDTLLAKLYREK